MTETANVKVRGLTRTFDDKTVVDGLDLTLRRGEFVALLGHSGCGKSTLLKILAGLDDETEGEVTVPERRSVAFQSPRLMPWLRVWAQRRARPARLPGPGARRAVSGRGGHRGVRRPLAQDPVRRPGPASGGQAQRVSLARALVREPELLLLDEPFGALDALTRGRAQRLVADLWQRHGCSVLLVTHDVEEALLLADRVLVMDGGRIAYEAEVGLERPRDLGSPDFVRLRGELLRRLGVHDASAHPLEEAPA